MNIQNNINKIKQAKSLLMGLNALNNLVDLVELVDKRKRSCSVRESNRDRNKNGFFNVKFLKLKEIDHEQFFIYTRMSVRNYNLLLDIITPFLEKCSIRIPVEPECRLAVLLIYLSQGSSMQSIAWSFKLGKETVRSIILEVAEVLWKTLGPIYVSEPNMVDLIQIREDFWSTWNLPNCIGAIDGKHIAIRCPPNSESQFFNYKKYFSVVLLAVCDAKYRFTYVDIGAYGSQSDGGIFQKSSMGKRLLGNKLPLPPAQYLPNSDIMLPNFFVGDAAFPLGPNMMRPYPGEHLSADKELFNKRLSRARRTIENAFGILVARWRVLLTTLHMYPENAEKIVLASIVLHNFIMFHGNGVDNSYSSLDIEPQNEANLQHIRPSATAHQYGGVAATNNRNSLKNFLIEN